MAVKEKLQILPHFIRWKPARLKADFQKKFIMHQFNILCSFHQKKKWLKVYFIILYLSVTGVIQVQEYYWLHHKTRDKFLKIRVLKASPGL